MPVVINEFEIVDEPPQESRRDEDLERENEQANQVEALLMAPHTIVRVIRHRKERLARVRAY